MATPASAPPAAPSADCARESITVTAQDLHVTYPGRDVPALRGANLTITTGQKIAVLGGNGHGKSTLLRCLAGAHKPTRGTIAVNGQPLAYTTKALTAHRRAVQLVLQDPDHQLFAASVYQDVSYGPAHLGLTGQTLQERVEWALETLNISHLADRPIHHLSYGERKRVAIAGSVAMKPTVLLLDEPTAGLDPAAVADLEQTLAELNTTTVMATHDIDLALRWAPHVAVLAEGHVTTGPSCQVLNDPATLDAGRLTQPTVFAIAECLNTHHAMNLDLTAITDTQTLVDQIAPNQADQPHTSDRQPPSVS